jgi:pimeloyl-ACP methyl ester carboxylesterase
MKILKTIIAIILALIAQAASATTQVPSGKWSFVFNDARGRADRPVRVYTYRPRQCDSACPIMFVMHGVKRDASSYRDYWEFAADRYGFIIIAPEFHAWPKAAAYNLGDLATQADREKWSFSVIEHLFDEMRDGQKDYRIFGHAAGAQFVQRMALFRPDNRASVMVAASPGWYTMPEWRKDKGFEPFPYSLLNSRAGENELRQALAKRFVLMVAARDVEPDDENLGNSAGAKKQGEGNVERGENFFKAANAVANDLGVKLAWELIEVPDASQDGEKMSRAAAEMLYVRK